MYIYYLWSIDNICPQMDIPSCQNQSKLVELLWKRQTISCSIKACKIVDYFKHSPGAIDQVIKALPLVRYSNPSQILEKCTCKTQHQCDYFDCFSKASWNCWFSLPELFRSLILFSIRTPFRRILPVKQWNDK